MGDWMTGALGAQTAWQPNRLIRKQDTRGGSSDLKFCKTQGK